MNAITIDALMARLAEVNERYPRPGIPPLVLSALCDLKDRNAPWPHAEYPGVYALFNEERELVYVGKASCNTGLGYRVRAHFDKFGAAKVPSFDGIRYLATIPVPKDRAFEAPAIEEFLICHLNPPLNSTGRTTRAPILPPATG